jgi:hypothetical protein
VPTRWQPLITLVGALVAGDLAAANGGRCRTRRRYRSPSSPSSSPMVSADLGRLLDVLALLVKR